MSSLSPPAVTAIQTLSAENIAIVTNGKNKWAQKLIETVMRYYYFLLCMYAFCVTGYCCNLILEADKFMVKIRDGISSIYFH